MYKKNKKTKEFLKALCEKVESELSNFLCLKHIPIGWWTCMWQVTFLLILYKFYMVRALEGKYGTILSRGTDNESRVCDDSLVISSEGK